MEQLSPALVESRDWRITEVEDDLLDIQVVPKPKEKYPASHHAKSVVSHLGETKGLIYLPGLGDYLYDDSDQPVYFRQKRYFYYLSGINFPDCTVTYDIHQQRLIAWIPPPSTGRSVIYNGFTPTIEGVKRNYDFDDVFLNTDLQQYITNFLNGQEGKVFITHRYQAPDHVTFKLNNIDHFGNRNHKQFRFEDYFDSEKLKPAMDAARAIKSPYEIKMIRKANEITTKAHLNVLRSIKNLHNEADVEAIFTATCIANQARTQAYGIIAGSGENAATLHYEANNESLRGRQLIVVDAGCEWDCYASDVTRTFPISGRFSKEGKQIYDLVALMQEECIAMVKSGVNYRDINLHAHKVATRGLLGLGILRGEYEELYKSGVSAAFLPHGLGHYLGLEVHDFGDGGDLLFGFSRLPKDWFEAHQQILSGEPASSSASLLKANHVITVEPGIYFSRYALEEVYLKDERYAKYINKDLLEKYYPIGGVRIEDDILVTEHGYENLTTTPKGDEALRIINGEDKITNETGRSPFILSKWFWK